MPLDAPTGYVLSLVDGRCTVDTILDISGLGEVRTIRILGRLLELGVVAMGASKPTETSGAGRPTTMRRVEVLVVEGCPNAGLAVERVYAATTEIPVPVHVSLVRIESHEDAARLRFLGSPTVRVDGVDVDPGAEARDDFGLGCRIY